MAFDIDTDIDDLILLAKEFGQYKRGIREFIIWLITQTTPYKIEQRNFNRNIGYANDNERAMDKIIKEYDLDF